MTSKNDCIVRVTVRARCIYRRQGTYLEIVHLPRDNREQNAGLENRPPFDTVVRGLRGIPVCTLANHDVLLLVFDGRKAMGEGSDFTLNWGDDV